MTQHLQRRGGRLGQRCLRTRHRVPRAPPPGRKRSGAGRSQPRRSGIHSACTAAAGWRRQRWRRDQSQPRAAHSRPAAGSTAQHWHKAGRKNKREREPWAHDGTREHAACASMRVHQQHANTSPRLTHHGHKQRATLATQSRGVSCHNKIPVHIEGLGCLHTEQGSSLLAVQLQQAVGHVRDQIQLQRVRPKCSGESPATPVGVSAPSHKGSCQATVAP